MKASSEAWTTSSQSIPWQATYCCWWKSPRKPLSSLIFQSVFQSGFLKSPRRPYWTTLITHCRWSARTVICRSSRMRRRGPCTMVVANRHRSQACFFQTISLRSTWCFRLPRSLAAQMMNSRLSTVTNFNSSRRSKPCSSRTSLILAMSMVAHRLLSATSSASISAKS